MSSAQTVWLFANYYIIIMFIDSNDKYDIHIKYNNTI